MTRIYTNARIFDGEQFIRDFKVVTEDSRITAIIPKTADAQEAETFDCGGKLLVPAFVDLQVYGAKQLLFSAYPSVDALQALAAHNAASGTSSCLATIATQPPGNIYACIDAIRAYINGGGTGVLGMHLEGPFINPAKRGAHVAEWIYAPNVDEVDRLLTHANGIIKMVTVAPERINAEVIQSFLAHNVIVSIGHSDADFATATAAFNGGARTATHLFNAMSSLHQRQPGLPAAVMLHPTAYASIIPDGIHVDYEIVKLAKQMMGERLYFITDAVTGTSTGSYRHVFNSDHYVLPDGTLSGSALTMISAVRNAVQHCGIPLEEALRMASLYPARVMKLDDQLGRSRPGYRASFALLNEDLTEATVM